MPLNGPHHDLRRVSGLFLARLISTEALFYRGTVSHFIHSLTVNGSLFFDLLFQ